MWQVCWRYAKGNRMKCEDIDDLLTLLPEDEERLMYIRLEGYDAQEIADAFGIDRNAVYQRVNRIMNKLRNRYEA